MTILAVNMMGLAIVIGAALVAAVVVVVIVLKNRKAGPAQDAPAAHPAHTAQPVPTMPAPIPAPAFTAAPSPDAAPAPKPATLQVEALAPTPTDMTPMLADPEPELGISTGTDELPRFGTAEMPQLQDVPATYRTPGANELAKAIREGKCPKCGADTFVGSEDPQDDSTSSLTGRCGACGHRAQLIDMRVG